MFLVNLIQIQCVFNIKDSSKEGSKGKMMRASRCSRLNFRYPHSVILTAIENRGFGGTWWFPWLNKLGTVKLTLAIGIIGSSSWMLYKAATVGYREFYGHAKRPFSIHKVKVTDEVEATKEDDRRIRKGLFGGKIYRPDGNKHFKGHGSMHTPIAPGTVLDG